jgi:hypothetical protein
MMIPHFAMAMSFPRDPLRKDVVEWKDVVIPHNTVVENVVVMGGNVTIAGTVKDEVVVINGNLTLQKTAQLWQRATVIGGHINREDGSVVREGIINIGPASTNIMGILLAGLLVILMEFVQLVLTAALVVIPPVLSWLFPRQCAQLLTVCERNVFKNVVLGVLCSIAFLIIEALMVLSIIGFPLAIFLGLLFIAVMLFGLNGLCAAIGARIAARIDARDKPLLIQNLYGSTALALMINIPFAGFLVLLLAMLFGIGSVLLLLLKKRKNPA